MEIIVLGNNGPFVDKNGACSSYLIKSKDANILNDCGTGSTSNLFKYIDPINLDAIILSHLHYDHISDLYTLGYYLNINNKTIDLFLPDHPRDIYEQFRNNNAFNVFLICDCNMITIKDVLVTFCEMTHPIKSFACKFRDSNSTFVYSGDTNYNERIGEFSKKCDLLIVDGGNAKPHLFPEDCDLIKTQSNAKLFIISHLNPSFDNKNLFNHQLAQIGDIYKLD